MKEPERNDPVWKLLGNTRRIEVDPFFSRNVVREVRKLRAAGEDRESILERILLIFRQPALAGVAAAAAILIAVFVSSDPGSDSPVAGEFGPTEEIEAIGYLGELMTVTDTDDLDDAALADLLILASR